MFVKCTRHFSLLQMLLISCFQPSFNQRTLAVGGKYYCMAGLQFDWFRFSRFTTKINVFSCLVESTLVKLETFRTHRDISFYKVSECSLLQLMLGYVSPLFQKQKVTAVKISS